ncbi:MAG: DUF4291 family protein [Alphaproteobacteria bacterium]|nr:DUF4291 family protein [Alphaproteobacteria bacterium]MCB9696519.1 DUF4291 family protein [Alphaproteobacteria bacterium]
MSAVVWAPQDRTAGLEAPGGRPLLGCTIGEEVLGFQAHGEEVADDLLAHGMGSPHCRAWRLDLTTRLRLSLPALLARTDWGRLAGRERILGVRMSRAGFDAMLRSSVLAENVPSVYASAAAFRLATRYAGVLVTWHGEVDPNGDPLPWQTPRFSLRDQALHAFTHDWVIGVMDLTPWVRQHRDHRSSGMPVPVCGPIPVSDADRLRLTGA